MCQVFVVSQTVPGSECLLTGHAGDGEPLYVVCLNVVLDVPGLSFLATNCANAGIHSSGPVFDAVLTFFHHGVYFSIQLLKSVKTLIQCFARCSKLVAWSTIPVLQLNLQWNRLA